MKCSFDDGTLEFGFQYIKFFKLLPNMVKNRRKDLRSKDFCRKGAASAKNDRFSVENLSKMPLCHDAGTSVHNGFE